MTLTRTEQLVNAFAAARAAARVEANRDDPDVGSCNLDTCFLRARRGTTERMVQEAAGRVGVAASRRDGGFWRGWMLYFPEDGIASQRTRIAEAAAAALRAHGEDACVYYALD